MHNLQLARILFCEKGFFDADSDSKVIINEFNVAGVVAYPSDCSFSVVIDLATVIPGSSKVSIKCLDSSHHEFFANELSGSHRTFIINIAHRFTSPEDLIRFHIYLDGQLIAQRSLGSQVSQDRRESVLSAKMKMMASASGSRISFSQSGEDLIVFDILNNLKIARPTYLDIGSFHPSELSNTYLMYLHGYTGVCVEPNPAFLPLYKAMRPRDTFLNIGVAQTESHPQAAHYFMMSAATLNTFSREEAYRVQEMGEFQIVSVINMPLLSVNEIIERHFSGKCPNFVSIDVEGLDLEILKTIDFERFRPEMICVESEVFTNSMSRTESKRNTMLDLMRSKGYLLWADTGLNSIYLEESLLPKG